MTQDPAHGTPRERACSQAITALTLAERLAVGDSDAFAPTGFAGSIGG
jgi:hypothetical protein